MLQFAFVFGIEIPSGTFMYMSEYNDPYKYAVTISINCKDICFCIAWDIRHQKVIPFITGEYVSLKSTSGLCVKPCATNLIFVSYHHIIFVSLSNKNPGYHGSPVTAQKSGYDRFPPVANSWGTTHPILDMAPQLLVKEDGPPTTKELNPEAICIISLPHYSRHGRAGFCHQSPYPGASFTM
jgi:hypothetical protein